VSYEINWEPRGVVKRYFGCLTGHDLLQAVVDTEADARFDDYRYVINDFLAIEAVDLADADIEQIAAIDKAAARINPNIRIAIVATLPEVLALANQYVDSPLGAYPTRVFARMTDARAWLGTVAALAS
jgi:hypothetical protein